MLEKKDNVVRLTGQERILGGLLARGIPGGSNIPDCPTIETLSEFIDGKLSPDARRSVVKHLGDCERCSATLSESLAIREALTNQSRARIKKYLFTAIPPALAAAAVLLVVFRVWQPAAPELVKKAEREPAYREAPVEKAPLPKQRISFTTRSFADELSSRLEKNDNAVSLARIAENRSKPVTPYGFSSIVPPEKTAFRIGVSLLDLEVALKAKDKEKIEVFAKKLLELLKPMESYGLIPPTIEASGNSGKEASHYEGFSGAVEALFKNKKEAVYLSFGAWVEAACLAAEAHDAAFFKSAKISGFKDELEKNGAPLGTLKNLMQLEAIMSSGGIQADQLKTMGRLLADIKEMF